MLLLTPYKVCAAEDVAPLVVAAHFQHAAVFLVQHKEIVALHQHVAHFKESEAALHTLLVAFRGKHPVNAEQGAYVAHEFKKVERMEPISVVFNYCGILAFKVQHVRHLLLEAGGVMLNFLGGHHAAHVGLAGGVADVCRAAAEQHYGPVARALHMRHGHQRNIVADVQAVCRGVEADVEGQFLFAHQFPEFFGMGTLLNKAAFLKYVVCVSHFSLLENMLFAYYFEFVAKPFTQKRAKPVTAVLIKAGLINYQRKGLV